MSYEQQYRDIANYFAANFTLLTAQQIQWGMARFTKPEVKEGDPIGSSWVRFNIVPFQDKSEGYLGKNEPTRSKGTIVVQCFTPQGVGEIYGRKVADGVADVFKSAQFSGVDCDETVIRALPQNDGWQQLNAETDFISNV